MFDATQDEQEQPACHHRHETIKVPIWFFESMLEALHELTKENATLKHHLNPTHEE